jgi:hypothetical protein
MTDAVQIMARANGGLRVTQVEAGTMIRDERTGQKIAVTDDTCVRKGDTILCTERTFDALRRAARPQDKGA